jgi:hypothetical protein
MADPSLHAEGYIVVVIEKGMFVQAKAGNYR